MNQNILNPELNKSICEAVNCYAEATINIKVKVGNSSSGGGKGRTIALSLCNNCVKKFQEEDILLE
jgi:hypothetical protein